METIKIKFRTFEIIEKYDNGDMKLSRKNKTYYAKHYAEDDENFDLDIYKANRFDSAMILAPRMNYVDKKQRLILKDFVEGQTVLEYMVNNDVTETMYSNIFTLAKMARVNFLGLDYSPDKWIITKDGLMYIANSFEEYKKENDFSQKGIRLWFITREFVTFAKEKGYEINPSRVKEEYATNKEIVLMTCKYYS